MVSIFKNRLFILFLVVIIINIFLKNFFEYNLFNLSNNKNFEGFIGSKKNLPCVKFPKNIDDTVELQTNVSRLSKAIIGTIASLDKIIGKAIKKKHSDKLFNSKIDAFFLKIEDKCSKIKLDGKKYSYQDLLSLKNLTAEEKKKLKEYDSEKLKHFEEEASDSDRKKMKDLSLEIKNNFSKFENAYNKYIEKGKDSKIYLTNEKMTTIIASMMKTGIPAYTLILTLFNRIKYKDTFKKNRARYLINSEITLLENMKDLSEKLLKSKMYKEFTSKK